MSNRSSVGLLFSFGLIILISGCAGISSAPEPFVFGDQQKENLIALRDWRIDGKLGYRDSASGGSAWVDWRQKGSRFDLSLNGPFGAGATRIEGDDQYARLSRGDEEPVSAPSAADLTYLLFGWSWPVEEIVFWVRGLPSDTTSPDLALYSDQGVLTELQQSGWSILFSNYERIGDLVLPGRIKGRNGDLQFTLVIKQWELEQNGGR